MAKDFFSKGHSRTIVAKKNIALSLVLKGGSAIILLFMVPMTINFVSPIRYGLWITFGSIITWVNFFDIGLGNGLKNKLTESIAKGEDTQARIYVSTTYSILVIISASILVVFLVINQFLDWSDIFNAPKIYSQELNSIAIILFSIFSLQFVLQLINVVSASTQNTALPNLIALSGNLLSIILLFIFSRNVEGSLIYLCLSVGLGPLISFILFTVGLYSSQYKKYLPSWHLVNFAYAKDLIQLGLKFFIINISLIFFYHSNNIIISRTIGPEFVTPYSVAFQYFNIITMISGIVMTPFWTAFNEANALDDTAWIARMINRLEKLCIGILILSLLMLIVSPLVYSKWIGSNVSIPFSLSAVLSFYVAMNTLRTVYCYYMIATGKIMLEMYILIASAALNIPLAILLSNVLDITGVILSTTILCFFCGIIEYSQYRKLITKKAYGIWNK